MDYTWCSFVGWVGQSARAQAVAVAGRHRAEEEMGGAEVQLAVREGERRSDNYADTMQTNPHCDDAVLQMAVVQNPVFVAAVVAGQEARPKRFDL